MSKEQQVTQLLQIIWQNLLHISQRKLPDDVIEKINRAA